MKRKFQCKLQERKKERETEKENGCCLKHEKKSLRTKKK